MHAPGGAVEQIAMAKKSSIGIVFIVAMIAVVILIVVVTIPNHPPTMPGNHRYSMSLHP